MEIEVVIEAIARIVNSQSPYDYIGHFNGKDNFICRFCKQPDIQDQNHTDNCEITIIRNYLKDIDSRV